MIAVRESLTELPDVQDADGRRLSDYIQADRYALVWWHPQALSPASCKTCSGSSLSEPIKMLMSIYDAGCDVIGLSYASADRLQRYLEDIGVEYPILSVDEEAARAHHVAKAEGEEWPSIPRRVAYLVDENRRVINRYDVHDATVFLRTVLGDVRNGPPTSKWETPAPSKVVRLKELLRL